MRWHCVAIGRVQGVGYRARVVDAARLHDVVGSVMNRPDGSVHIDVQAPEQAIAAFIAEIARPHGLSHPRIVRRVAEFPPAPELLSFEVRTRDPAFA